MEKAFSEAGNIDGIEVSTLSATEPYRWTLSNAEQDSNYRIVAMKFESATGAANFYSYQVTIYDTDGPDIPPSITSAAVHESAPGEFELDVNWQYEGELWGDIGFEVDYKVGEAPWTTETGIYSPAANIPLPGADYNEEILLRVYTVDIAGNRSQASPPETEAAYSVYTPVYLGDVLESFPISAAYEPPIDGGDVNRYITWTLNGGKVAYYTVSVEPDCEGDIVIKPGKSSTNFRINGLTPQTQHTLTLTGYNSGGQAAAAVERDYDLANYKPEKAELSFPLNCGWTENLLFNWTSALDPDELQVTYTLAVKADNEQDYTILAEDLTATEYHYQAKDADYSFTDGVNYAWKVTTTDTAHEGYTAYSIESDPGAFLADGGTPRIYFSKNLPFYINSDITVLIDPARSTIEPGMARYKTSAGQEGELKDLSLITSGPDTGKYSARVPLEDSNAPYNLTVEVHTTSGAHNTSMLPHLRVDKTHPVLVDFTPAHLYDPEALRYYIIDKTLSLKVVLNDGFAGCRSLSYTLLEDPAAEAGETAAITVSETSGTTGDVSVSLDIPVDLADGSTCYLALRAEDFAGNRGLAEGEEFFVLPAVFYVDGRKPELEVAWSGGTAYGGECYFADPDLLDVQAVLAADEHSRLASVTYTLCDPAEEAPVWYASWDAAARAALCTDGHLYELRVKALDNAGNKTVFTETLNFDGSGPVLQTPDVGPQLPLPGGHLATITTAATDPDSPLTDYLLAIGETAGGTEITSQVSGNEEGWMSQSTPSFSFTLPKVSGNYKMTFQAKNAAGKLADTPVVLDVEIRSIQNILVVETGRRYQKQTDSFYAHWSCLRTQPIAGYRYRLEGPGYADSPWQPEDGSLTAITEITWLGLSLQHNAEYSLQVEAYYAGGAPGPLVAASPGVKIDTTKPNFLQVSAPKACNAENFRLSWDVEEEESEITSLQVLLEVPGENGEREAIGPGWISLPATAQGSRILRSDAAGDRLDLSDGTPIYLTLQVINPVGLSDFRALDKVIFDNSPPAVPLVVDQGDSIRTEQVAENGLNFKWHWSEGDKHSGIRSYSWQAVVVPWNAGLTAKEILEAGTYLEETAWSESDGSGNLDWTGPGLPAALERAFLFVKATNNAGASSIGYSDGITSDSDGPYISAVRLTLSDDEQEPDARYINRTDNLWLQIDARDLQTPIAEYIGEYGAISGGNFSALCEPYRLDTGLESPPLRLGRSFDTYPQLTEGTLYYFRGSCANKLQMPSEEANENGLSGGVKLDTFIPQISDVTAANEPGIFRFSWQVETLFAPVKTTSLELWEVIPSGADYNQTRYINTFTTSANEYTIDLAAYNTTPNLPENQKIDDGYYRLYLRSENQAGSLSITETSPVIMYDTFAPEISVRLSSAEAKSEYAYDYVDIHYEVSDYLDGIIQPENLLAGNVDIYKYRVGIFGDPDAFTKEWKTVKTTEINPVLRVNFADFKGELNDGISLRIETCSVDKAGNESATLINYIKTDLSPPVFAAQYPRLTNPYIASYAEVYGLQLDIADDGSGITAYRTLLTADNTQETLTQLAGQAELWNHTPLASPLNRLTGINYNAPARQTLADGDTRYVAVMARNAVGLWSDPVCSEQAIIDSTPPGVKFSTKNGILLKGDEYVYNEEHFRVWYTLADSVSPTVDMEAILLNGSGAPVLDEENAEVHITLSAQAVNSEKEFTHPFDPAVYATYHLVFTLSDLAGNNTQLTQKLRVNRPPSFAFGPDYETNPGKPLTLTAIPDNDDSGEKFTYFWEILDYPTTPEVNLDWFTPDLQKQETPEVKLYHEIPATHASTYQVRLTITDADERASEPVTRPLTVYNTTRGELHANEYWIGDETAIHVMAGTVTVPPQYSLTIPEFTTVNIKSDNEGAGYGLAVAGTLTIANNAELKLESSLPPPYWQGIHILPGGTASITGAIIRHARRGVTIDNDSSVLLANSRFYNNLTAIHILQDKQKLEGNTITGSYYYGIKEELGITPVLKDNTFSGNNIAYYDKNDTSLTEAELNNRNGNENNTITE